jgi:hypothetical protein
MGWLRAAYGSFSLCIVLLTLLLAGVQAVSEGAPCFARAWLAQCRSSVCGFHLSGLQATATNAGTFATSTCWVVPLTLEALVLTLLCAAPCTPTAAGHDGRPTGECSGPAAELLDRTPAGQLCAFVELPGVARQRQLNIETTNM